MSDRYKVNNSCLNIINLRKNRYFEILLLPRRITYLPLGHFTVELKCSWVYPLEVIPKSILMMLVDSVNEFMDNDIVTEFLWESHQLDIETDTIFMTTAPPSGFLVTTGHS